jgi:peptidoglycan/LPS O-acetylase OafA/YrhL
MKLGAFRFFLASLVAISHLWAEMIHGPAAYSVWGFYLISGYLMGYILNEKYNFTKIGLAKFYCNRIIRIYPGYIFSIVIGIFVYKLCINNSIPLNTLNPEFGKPIDLQGILFNLTLLPIFQTSNLLVPVSQALGLEVGFYLLAPLIAINRNCAYLALIITAGINWKLNIIPGTFGARYSGYWSALLPFSLGIIIFFHKNTLMKFASLNLAILLWIMHGLLWLYFPSYPWEYGLYISLIFTGFVLVSNANLISGKFDQILGDMSYMVYLLHTTIGYFLIASYKFEEPRNFIFFLYTYIFTCIISFLFIIIIERPVQKKIKLILRGYLNER